MPESIAGSIAISGARNNLNLFVWTDWLINWLMGWLVYPLLFSFFLLSFVLRLYFECGFRPVISIRTRFGEYFNDFHVGKFNLARLNARNLEFYYFSLSLSLSLSLSRFRLISLEYCDSNAKFRNWNIQILSQVSREFQEFSLPILAVWNRSWLRYLFFYNLSRNVESTSESLWNPQRGKSWNSNLIIVV